MGFTVEQECPQCAAPVVLDETDRLLNCPYCGVKNFLFAPGHFRFVLPHKASDRDIIYVPYLRFKGNVFYCRGMSLGYRVVDITRVGLELKRVPASLGIRPQAMKLKFVTPDATGSFLRFALKAADIIEKAGRLSSLNSSGELLHRAFIGETLSLIYLPLYVEGNNIYDAILQRPIADLNRDRDQSVLDQDAGRNPQWGLTFIATLCPRCGWNLAGEKDSVVMTCSNCDTAWEALDGKFKQVDFLTVPGIDEDAVYLPFWKSDADVEGLKIDSFADFIRITNQPRVLKKDWEKEDMSFWSPAFKIRPKLFLNLAKQLTVSQRHFHTKETIPKHNLYPATLHRNEAVQGMKITLAASAVNKRAVLPMLPRVKFRIKNSTLVYLPFQDTGHEMVQEQMGISINNKALEYGRHL